MSEETAWMKRDADYEPGVPAHHKRKGKADKPRAARVDLIDAKLYAIGRDAVVAWQEEHE
jgi:hypothetical protein